MGNRPSYPASAAPGETFKMKICVIYMDQKKLASVTRRLSSLRASLTQCRVEEVACDDTSVRFIAELLASTLTLHNLAALHDELVRFFKDIVYVELGDRYQPFNPVHIIEKRARTSSGSEPPRLRPQQAGLLARAPPRRARSHNVEMRIPRPVVFRRRERAPDAEPPTLPWERR